MAQRNISNFSALQIVLSEEFDENQQIIKLVESNKPQLEYILCEENKNLPIFVISICGKTRTGKSLLLNLIVKFLESKGKANWKNGALPNVFESKGGKTSVTRGLWISPKVYKLKNQRGNEVGVLLMDNQGLYDGEQTEGVSVAISGISTLCSSYQIFNVKDSICESDLESIWRHLISDKSSTSDASATKLVFAVRDYLDEENGCGLDHGKAYMEAEKIRGKPSHKEMWKGLCETFPDIICLLLPFPGEKVRIGKAEYMEDINPQFLKELEKFFNKMFCPKYLDDIKNSSTGDKLFETLNKFDKKIADESLSFMNVHTEQGNQNKLESLRRNFESRIRTFKLNPSSGQSIILEFLKDGRKMFLGSSSADYLKKLESHMVDKINSCIEILTMEAYRKSLHSTDDVIYTHSMVWGIVKTRVGYFVGSEEEKKRMEEKVILNCAELYYNTLVKKLSSRFGSFCEHKTLKELQGYDEEFVSREFKEHSDFKNLPPTTQGACSAVWLKEKEYLRLLVQDKLLTCVELLTKVSKERLFKAVKEQYKFYEIFTWNDAHWITIEKSDKSLQEVVAYTMYKKTQDICLYSDDQKKIIEKISNQIIQQSRYDPITMTCVFIMYAHDENESCEPVYKVNNGPKCVFIDIMGRIYPSWDSFEEDNELPADCLYCHPCWGEYGKKQGFRVGFSWSPASKLGNKILKGLDTAAKVVGVGAAGALGALAALPGTPVVAIGGAIAAGFSGGYGLIRGIFKVKDKIDHEQGVEAADVVDIAANSLSIATAGFAAGAVVLTTIGRELACAPAIIQSISSLTNIVFQLNRDNISYLSVANDISMFLLFNNRSIEGSLKNIRTLYNLPPGTSSIATLNAFISKNSIAFPQPDGERLTTGQVLSENLKTFLLTAIVNKSEERSLQFLKDTVSTSNELKPLLNLFCDSTKIKEQIRFFEELIKTVAKVLKTQGPLKNSQLVSYLGIGYHPTTEVEEEVCLTGVCTGLTSVIEGCSDNECIQAVCCVARKIIQLVYENAGTPNLQKMTAYLEKNADYVVGKV